MATVERPLAIRKVLDAQISDNKHGAEGWLFYGNRIADYELTFGDILHGKPISSLLGEKNDIVAVDLMSSSSALRSLFVEVPYKTKFGLAVSLGDIRSREEKKADEKLNIEQLEGDLLDFNFWEKDLRPKLKGRKADLVLERAEGGLFNLTDNYKVHLMLLRRAWNILSSDNGVFLFQMPALYGYKFSQMRMLREFFDKKGIDFSFAFSALGELYCAKLVKTPDSPEKLPFLK